MAKEGQREDAKLGYDPTNPKARLDLVKDVVAIANSGGGTITFGRTESSDVGLPEESIKALDSAEVSDLVDRYISPSNIRLSQKS